MYIVQESAENALLPAEILTEIFKKLSNETLFTCLSVCKTWFHPAGQVYYRQLRIGDNIKRSADIKKIVEYISKFPDLLIGDKVRTMQIEGQRQIGGRIISGTSTPTPSSKEELQALLQMCPHLQELAFSINSVYWKYVYEMDPHITHIIRPRRLFTVGKLRCYEEEYFYKVAHQFRSSISELEIYCSCDASIHDGFGSLYSYLADFPLMKSLSIKSGSQRYMVYLDQLLNSCKRLRQLNFQLDHPFFERQPYSGQQSWSEYPSLQELDIYQSTFNAQQLQYIIYRFKNLKNFTLRMNQIDIHQRKLWKNEQDKHLKSAMQFFKSDFMAFLAHLNQLHLHFNIHGRSYVEYLMEHFYLPSLYSGKHSSAWIEASFEVNHGRTERTQIEIQKGAQKQTVNYTFVRDFSVADPTMDEDLQVESTEHLPYLTHLESYGKHLQRLHITTTSKAKHREAADLDLVLCLCPNLQELTLIVEISPGAYFSPDVSLMNHQHPPSHCWNYNPRSALNSKLAALTVKGITITRELLRAIARNHPRLKNLCFVNCLSESIIENDPLAQSSLSFHMYDLSNLHLESLVFDIFAHRYGKKLVVPMVCIAIESEDKSCNYYLAKQQKDPVTDELFNSISTAMYKQLITDKEAILTVLWFKVKALDNLELQAGRNQSLIKKIQPR
ncbi:uncharacterized protein ATC70_000834 [Mucor velutinosus]|uniref:F-box domain-containing protein n=1 Tax=Mucor velutinosus TaxID=708070 RepID=A0AAN7DK70_9FUNG|nr:hypothetical protein ATC70_000834 [Mucor velutinosus]